MLNGAKEPIAPLVKRIKGNLLELQALLPFFLLLWAFGECLLSTIEGWLLLRNEVLLGILASSLLVLGYISAYEVGKRQSGLGLIGPNAQPASLWRRFLRYGLKYLFILPGFLILQPESLAERLDGKVESSLWIGYLTGLLSIWIYNLFCVLAWPSRRSLADQISGTRLMRAETQKAPGFFILLLLFPIFLAPLIVPLSLNQRGGAKISSAYANMHTLQTMLETYSANWNGYYPPDLKTLQQEALQYDGWKDFTNPYTGKSGIGLSVSDSEPIPVSKRHFLFVALPVTYCLQARGVVLYVPGPAPARTYKIFVCGKNHALIQNRGEIRVLSNS